MQKINEDLIRKIIIAVIVISIIVLGYLYINNQNNTSEGFTTDTEWSPTLFYWQCSGGFPWGRCSGGSTADADGSVDTGRCATESTRDRTGATTPNQCDANSRRDSENN